MKYFVFLTRVLSLGKMNKTSFLSFSALFLCLVGSLTLNAQLTVVQGSAMNLTPEQLVQNYLIGSGITISNVTYNGSSSIISSNQIGNFSTAGAATTQLGLPGGILMTSGKASVAIGPNNGSGAGFNAGGAGDPDLNIISSSTTHDKCVIEFDFIPQSDTVRFRYVFGSDEFFEYCNQFNDAFGFFLSGPGISGTFSNSSSNIAIMPGTANTYVTINNICSNTLSRWNNASGIYYQYDGLTFVFTAWHVVTPCTTYHIKLAVADAVDYAFDSGVFLEQNSFSSPSVTLQLSNSSPGLENKAVEGCSDVTVNFTMESALNSPYTVKYLVSGTATNGIDYTQIPTQITFPIGVDTVALVIHPLVDGQTEGPQTVIIKVDQISCNGVTASDTIVIDDYSEMTMQLRQDTSICHGTSLKFVADVTGGIYPYNFSWANSSNTDSVLNIVLPVGDNTVICTVSDVCPNYLHDSTQVTVHPKPLADAGNDISIPNGTSTTLTGNGSGGYGTYGYSWTSNPPGFNSNIQNPNTGNLFLTKIFMLDVTDQFSGCLSDPSQVIIAVAGGVLSANPVADPSAVCLGDEVNLFTLAGGGSGLYSYLWSSVPAGFISTESNPVTIPNQNTTYYVSVNDGFNSVNGSTSVIVNPLPYIHLGPVDSTVCIYDSITLDAGNPGSTYVWSNGSTSRKLTISSAGLSFEVQSYQVIVTNPNFCIDSAFINVIFSFNACVGVNEKESFTDFSIYPNPNNGSFTLTIKPKEELTNFVVYNMTGKKIFSDIIRGVPGKAVEKSVFLPSAATGIYLIQISGSDYSGTKKLIIK